MQYVWAIAVQNHLSRDRLSRHQLSDLPIAPDIDFLIDDYRAV